MHISRSKVFVGDEHLDPIPPKKMGEFLVVDTTDDLKWVRNKNECNAFALYLRANASRWFYKKDGLNAAVGTIWVRKYKSLPAHAFNFYVTPKYNFHYIEPQTDLHVFLDQRKVMLVII